ncbi:MAG: NifU family protein [candidate division WOR-3 bacterium]
MAEDLRGLVERIVSEQIRPGLRFDGGDLEVVEVRPEGTVYVRLKGHCASCPFSEVTLTARVEKVLKEACAQISRVLAVD